MEELRSTEILDKEIQADARKKAEKVLAAADEECRKILEGVSARIEAARAEKSAEYGQKAASFCRNREASVPLEEQRHLVSFESQALLSATNRYLGSLGAEGRRKLLCALAGSFSPSAGGGKFSAEYFGMERKDAESLLEGAFGKKPSPLKEIGFGSADGTFVPGLEFHEGVIARSGPVRMRITLDEIIAGVLDAHRRELADALFCGRLPE